MKRSMKPAPGTKHEAYPKRKYVRIITRRLFSFALRGSINQSN